MSELSELQLSRDEVRAVDAAAIEQLGIAGLVLMENAARGVADVVRAEFPDARRIVILCGHGNNGGDGFALARQLAACAISADVLMLQTGRELSADAAANRKILTKAGIVCRDVEIAQLSAITESLGADDLIVDCLLGTGVRGSVRSPFDAAIAAVNASQAAVLAVDVPSGLDCETGEPCGSCVRAARTVTFVARKRGFSSDAAQEFLGDVTVAHIGIPAEWLHNWLTTRRASGAS